MIKSPEKAEKRIKKWLREEGHYKKKIISDKLYFHFWAGMPESSELFDIFQPKDRKDSIVIATSIKFNRELRTLYKRLTKDEKDSLLLDLHMTLLQRDIEYSMMSGEIPLGIRLFRIIYYDALKKNELMKELMRIFRTTILINLKLDQYLKAYSGSGAGRCPMFR